MAEAFPQEIQTLLERKKFADAKKACEERGISTIEVQKSITDEINRANFELKNKNAESAMNYFINLIGAIEPSMVLCKFFSPHLTQYLTTFLVELHTRGYANEQHTRLLFNMFQKEDDTLFDKFLKLLEQAKSQKRAESQTGSNFFLFGKGDKTTKSNYQDLSAFYENFKQNTGAAMEVLVQNDMGDKAFLLSNIISIPSHRVSLLINSQENYLEASNLILKECTTPPGVENDLLQPAANQQTQNNLPTPRGRQLLLEYGATLISKVIAKKYPQKNIVIDNIISAAYQAWIRNEDSSDVDFIHAFWGYPEYCFKFVEKACVARPTPLLNTCLIDLTIPRSPSPDEKYLDKIFNLEWEGKPNSSYCLNKLRDSTIKFYFDEILFICNEVSFVEGVIACLERAGNYSAASSYYIAACEHSLEDKAKFDNTLSQYVKWLRNSPSLKNDDWVDVFQFFIKYYNKASNESFMSNPNDDPHDDHKTLFIQKIVLKNAKKARPLTSLIHYMSKFPNIPLRIVKKSLMKELTKSEKVLENEVNDHETSVREVGQIEKQIERLEGEDIEFRPMKCEVCHNKLDIPYIAFMCGHIVDRKCCIIGVGNVPICPICGDPHSEITPKYKMPEEAKRTIRLDPQQPDLLNSVLSLVHNGYFDK
ncbi:hypothetical protein TVAG_432930 [Trichomonas vaginalis G3]|uniref:RING-type domain-containing protein n=1 Tax=Trichomonas vaginalis (strain ATCC PRA-98 / G3) TaxID=412133 RepID=A2DIT4_TRIV3|nr:regulation of SNARE complex assembly [Trichomonas vaginalis G3]EAY19697.1 hypothetical protein TVAG_432930 [Trichomonas vaginalis G3]KAI5521283.1 regulation of SNARE complex assembly [Trichomonas vaginalis G3]|eukprot:XP_001580683.1 hypothetical protein [Trichomonas vaginalis G3]